MTDDSDTPSGWGDGTLKIDESRLTDELRRGRRATPRPEPNLPDDWRDGGTLKLPEDEVDFGRSQPTRSPSRTAPSTGESYSAGRVHRGNLSTERPRDRRSDTPRPAAESASTELDATRPIEGLALGLAIEAAKAAASQSEPDEGPPARTLVVFAPGERPRQVPLELERFWIGRQLAHQLVLADTACATRHAMLRCTDERVEVVDQNTDAGTTINGFPIAHAVLRHGDVLGIGEHHIRLVEGEVESHYLTLRVPDRSPEHIALPRARASNATTAKPGLLKRLFGGKKKR